MIGLTFPDVRCIRLNIVCIASVLTTGCSLLADDHEDLEEHCRSEARIIVHNDELWSDYADGSNQSYRTRKGEFPETGRTLTEYVPGFEQRYGRQLATGRTTVKGQVNRDDIYIMKDGKIVGQFVDFILPAYGFGGSGGINCTGLFPELYSTTTIGRDQGSAMLNGPGNESRAD